MRSRFSAYALCLADYIMDTTHPDNPVRLPNKAAWRKDILRFSQQTRFDNLKILEFADGDAISTVTFTAVLRKGQRDVSFTEKSMFARIEGRWLYRSGEVRKNASD
jgi:SEC-C motif domain protein